MRYLNTTGNRMMLEVFTVSGKQADYIEPFSLSLDYSEEVIRNSRDLQFYIAKGTLVNEGTEVKPEEKYAKVKSTPENKKVVEVVGAIEEEPEKVTVEGEEFFMDEGSVISKAPDKPFAEEKTMTQMASDVIDKVGEATDLIENKAELIKQQEEKIKKAVNDGLISDTSNNVRVSERVRQFNSLKFFQKKSILAKSTDKALLGEILACVPNENVKALVRQRLIEIG